MSKSIEDILVDVGKSLGYSVRDSFQSYINEKVDLAISNERRIGIALATGALYEAKVEEKIIIQLLQDYWRIDKSQAIESLRIEKTVRSPMRVLFLYLQSEGYSNLDIGHFMSINNVRNQLKNNQTLWKLSNSPAKLKKSIEEGSGL